MEVAFNKTQLGRMSLPRLPNQGSKHYCVYVFLKYIYTVYAYA